MDGEASSGAWWDPTNTDEEEAACKAADRWQWRATQSTKEKNGREKRSSLIKSGRWRIASQCLKELVTSEQSSPQSENGQTPHIYCEIHGLDKRGGRDGCRLFGRLASPWASDSHSLLWPLPPKQSLGSSVPVSVVSESNKKSSASLQIMRTQRLRWPNFLFHIECFHHTGRSKAK